MFFKLIKDMYSFDFCRVLSETFKLKFSRKIDQIPTLRLYKNLYKGMQIHNDIDFLDCAVAFIYCSTWEEDFGGEIFLYDENIKLKKVIKPKDNSFVCIPINEITFHSINKHNKNWNRACAYFPYYAEKIS